MAVALSARIRRAANVRGDEPATIIPVALVFLILEAGRSMGEIGATTLVWSRVAKADVPWLYIPLGITSMLVAVGFGAALGRVRRGRLFATVLVTAAVVLVVGSLAIRSVAESIPIVWLAVMAAGALAATLMWTTATSTLDARQAKRLFPLCTAAAILGSLIGSLVAGPLSGVLGTATLVAMEGLAFAVAALVVIRLASRGVGSGWRPLTGPRRPLVAEIRTGFDEVRGSPLLRLVAIAYVLLAILLFSITYPYQSAAKAAYPSDTALAGIFGTVSAAVTAASFLVSLLVADRFYRRFGVAAAALALPLVYLVGFGVWLVSFSFVSAAAVLIVLQVTQRGLSNAAWSAFYNVVPAARRAQAMAFNDGVPGQIGMVLSGILILATTSLLAPAQVSWVGFATAAVCTVIVIGIRRRYGDALVRSLRRGIGEQVLEGGPGLAERIGSPDVRRALIVALEDPEPGTRELAAMLLARTGSDADEALVAALDDPVPAVRAAAVVGILGGSEPGRPGSVARAESSLGALVEGDRPSRLAGLRAMRQLGRPLDPDRRATTVRDPEPAVRAAAMSLLIDATDHDATALLRHALDDPSPTVRQAAATALAAHPTPDPFVLDRLATADLGDQAVCLLALDGHGSAVRGPVIAWAERQVGRALALQDARRALLVQADERPGARDGRTFLVDVLAQRIGATQDLALAAMGVLGAPAARGVIRRCLRADDADIRAQAIEALDSLGDRRLGSLITRLVEPRTDLAVAETGMAVVERLRHDDDPWIRAAARRSATSAETMGETDGSLGDIETMLRLRRVPLFAGLAPEDLQRIATAAVECEVPAEAPLIREGEIGDALFVLLEGSVRVVHVAADGSEHLIRTYEAGDHIGELAVLRERPRAATVIADGGPVRALMLEGAGLMAILRERPDAAMAMLATLAERISTQA